MYDSRTYEDVKEAVKFLDIADIQNGLESSEESLEQQQHSLEPCIYRIECCIRTNNYEKGWKIIEFFMDACLVHIAQGMYLLFRYARYDYMYTITYLFRRKI